MTADRENPRISAHKICQAIDPANAKASPIASMATFPILIAAGDQRCVMVGGADLGYTPPG